MFGKLIKYELKSAGKWYLSLYAGILVVATLLGFFIKQASQEASDLNIISTSDSFTFLLMMVFVALLSGLFLATLLMIIARFNRNIYGREGYLTLTLPVSTHMLILAKLCTSFLWIILNALVLFFSMLLLMLPSMGLGNLLAALPRLRPILFSSEAILFMAFILVSIVASILLIYLAISIGQLFQDRRGLMGFVAYFTITVIWSFISYQIDFNFIGEEAYLSSFTNSYFTINIIQYLVFSILCYFGTHYIMKHKLNIQ